MIVVFATAPTAQRALGKHWSGRKPRPPPGAPSPPAPPSVPPYVAEDDIFCHNGHQLPMLFLLGAQKCGSTSLVYELWDQYGFAHGLPYRGRFNDGCDSYNDNKEKHFFEDDCRYAKGIDGYASMFPSCGVDVVTLDATPNYFTSADAPQRVAELYGEERMRRTTFAVMLCDPLQRAQSYFYHFAFKLDWKAFMGESFRQFVRDNAKAYPQAPVQQKAPDSAWDEPLNVTLARRTYNEHVELNGARRRAARADGRRDARRRAGRRRAGSRAAGPSSSGWPRSLSCRA